MRNKIRSELRSRLEEGETRIEVEGERESNVLSALLSLTFDEDPLIRERACVAAGIFCARMPRESVLRSINRLLWLLDPDSGANSEGVPRVLGEIGRNLPDLVETFLPTLLNKLDDIKLRPGILQAAGRIAEVRPAAIDPAVFVISQQLGADDEETVREARLALERIGTETALKALEESS